MPEDRAFAERLSEWLDGRLDPAQARRLEEELRREGRLEELLRLARTVELVRGLPHEVPPAGLVERIRAALDREEKPSPGGTLRRLLPWVLSSGVAAAAALLLMFTLPRNEERGLDSPQARGAAPPPSLSTLKEKASSSREGVGKEEAEHQEELKAEAGPILWGEKRDGKGRPAPVAEEEKKKEKEREKGKRREKEFAAPGEPEIARKARRLESLEGEGEELRRAPSSRDRARGQRLSPGTPPAAPAEGKEGGQEPGKKGRGVPAPAETKPDPAATRGKQDYLGGLGGGRAPLTDKAKAKEGEKPPALPTTPGAPLPAREDPVREESKPVVRHTLGGPGARNRPPSPAEKKEPRKTTPGREAQPPAGKEPMADEPAGEKSPAGKTGGGSRRERKKLPAGRAKGEEGKDATSRRFRRKGKDVPSPVSRPVLVVTVADLKELGLAGLAGVRVRTRTLAAAALRRQCPGLPPFSRARLVTLRGPSAQLAAALEQVGRKVKGTLRVSLALPPQPAPAGGDDLWELVVLVR